MTKTKTNRPVRHLSPQRRHPTQKGEIRRRASLRRPSQSDEIDVVKHSISLEKGEEEDDRETEVETDSDGSQIVEYLEGKAKKPLKKVGEENPEAQKGTD